MLGKLQQAVIDNQNVFAVLMNAASACSLGRYECAVEVGAV
jgi:hypothetical protein